MSSQKMITTLGGRAAAPAGGVGAAAVASGTATRNNPPTQATADRPMNDSMDMDMPRYPRAVGWPQAKRRGRRAPGPRAQRSELETTLAGSRDCGQWDVWRAVRQAVRVSEDGSQLKPARPGGVRISTMPSPATILCPIGLILLGLLWPGPVVSGA